MPTKAELEVENAKLAEQLAARGQETGCCDRLCPCAVPYATPCWSHIVGDTVYTCVCPDHPEQAPEPRPNV